ncbi:hypothetical protein BDFB_001159 [Asbolus verrucosus]|jgi:hypothetical protein
MKFQ